MVRGPPEWAGGLRASAPTPCHPVFPRDLLFSFCFFFPLWHFPTLPVPGPLHTVLHEGLGLPWVGLCAAACPLSWSQLGHCFRKDPSLFSLGECPALSLGSWEVCSYDSFWVNSSFSWNLLGFDCLIPFGDLYFPKLSMQKFHLLAECWHGCPQLQFPLWLSTGGWFEAALPAPIQVASEQPMLSHHRML